MVKLNKYDVVVFDLDDTLYSEADYVQSGFQYIASLIKTLFNVDVGNAFQEAIIAGETDVLGTVLTKYKLPTEVKKHLLLAYRYHQPEIAISEYVRTILDKLEDLHIPLYLVTDGRSLTQRLKINALGISSRFSHIFISEEIGVEKPAPKAFEAIQARHPKAKVVYIGDNPKKDFIAPISLGWDTIGIENQNSRIHRLPEDYKDKASCWITDFKGLLC